MDSKFVSFICIYIIWNIYIGLIFTFENGPKKKKFFFKPFSGWGPIFLMGHQGFGSARFSTIQP